MRRGFSSTACGISAPILLLPLIILLAAAGVGLVLWYGAILGWALVLHHVAQAGLTGEELEPRR
jgi:hypothetical protein